MHLQRRVSCGRSRGRLPGLIRRRSLGPAGGHLLWCPYHVSRRRALGYRHQHRHVYGGAHHPRRGERHRGRRRRPVHHRDCLPNAEKNGHGFVPDVLLPRLNYHRLVHVWHVSHRWRRVLAHPFGFARPPVGGPNLSNLACSRVSPLARKQGRRKEALAMLTKYHGENNQSDPVVQFEFQEITLTIEGEKAATQSSLFGFLREMVTGSGNRKRTMILIWAAICSQMSGNAFVSYYLAPVLTSVGLRTDLQQTLINATSQMVSWFSSMYFATRPARLGRRTLFLGFLVMMCLIIIFITAGSAVFTKDNANTAAGYSVVVLLYLFSPAYNFRFNGNLGLYILEILPFHLRTRGIGSNARSFLRSSPPHDFVNYPSGLTLISKYLRASI